MNCCFNYVDYEITYNTFSKIMIYNIQCDDQGFAENQVVYGDNFFY